MSPLCLWTPLCVPAVSVDSVPHTSVAEPAPPPPCLSLPAGQLELPAAGQLCPQIPSEQILDTGLYSQPSRPAYAVIDRSRRGGPLLPGLAAPPLPAAATVTHGEPQYANTPLAPPGEDPTYVNCRPAGIEGSTGLEGGTGVKGAVCIDGAVGIDGSTSIDGAAAAQVGAVSGSANYVNCSPLPASQQQQQQQRQEQQHHYQQCQHPPPPHHHDLHQQHHHHQQQHNQHHCQHHQAAQPLYVNTPACLALSPTGQHPAGDYLPMRPPSGAQLSDAQQPSGAQPSSGAQLPPGEDYLEMSGRPGRAALRRSRSVESGRQLALRSTSLGRKPMPSPKPERLRQLVVARGPGSGGPGSQAETR